MLKQYKLRTVVLRVLDYFGLLESRSFRVRLRNGLELKCRGGTNDFQILDEVFVKRIYENVLCFIRDGEEVIDVGANIGLFALAAALRGATVRCFEPLEHNYRLLCENVSLNGFEDRIIADNTAISCQAGTMDFYTAENDTAGATGHPIVHKEYFEGGSLKNTVQKLTVACTTLADVLRGEYADCCVLKMDCEGAEYGIFENADENMLRKISHIVMEYHPYPGKNIESIKNKLQQNGFDVALLPHLALLLASKCLYAVSKISLSSQFSDINKIPCKT